MSRYIKFDSSLPEQGLLWLFCYSENSAKGYMICQANIFMGRANNTDTGEVRDTLEDENGISKYK